MNFYTPYLYFLSLFILVYVLVFLSACTSPLSNMSSLRTRRPLFKNAGREENFPAICSFLALQQS